METSKSNPRHMDTDMQPDPRRWNALALLCTAVPVAAAVAAVSPLLVAGSIASLTGVAETEAGLGSGLNNASFQIGGAVGVAILSTVRRHARTRGGGRGRAGRRLIEQASKSPSGLRRLLETADSAETQQGGTQ
jgi:hypothetical protein